MHRPTRAIIGAAFHPINSAILPCNTNTSRPENLPFSHTHTPVLEPEGPEPAAAAMASASPPVQQPTPLRSPGSSSPALHHPTPDLQSLQGAYISNIERLEDRAERMSEAGSDLGEEIRKLQLEQKLTDSRRNSLRSAEHGEDIGKPMGGRSRGVSTSSYANSIVDVNNAARWGGYSPGGYMTSPVGSLRSGSFSPQVQNRPQRSGSRASRLGQILHADGSPQEQHDGFGSPRSHSPGPRSVPRQRSVSSFTQKYDQISQEIRDHLDFSFDGEGAGVATQNQHNEPLYVTNPALPDRPATAASTDTAQARFLWQDFDGAHCPDTVPEEDPMQVTPQGSRNSSLLKSAPGPVLKPAAPPDDGMVFYPAPVPQMLNLPKRLSKAPAASVQARRRTQLLESMQPDNRKSAPWLSEMGSEQPKAARKSRQSLAGLPPQLRASAFFDQPAPAQEFEVKGESAQETLDSILAASANAPASAFTDHPFAGHVGDEVYGTERKSRRLSSAVELDKADNRKSRSSLNLLNTRRNSSGDPLNKLKKRNSSADLNMLTVRAAESRMSLGDELDEPGHTKGPEAGSITPTRRSIDGKSETHSDGHVEGEAQAEEAEEEEQEHQFFGPPTTLLAELQMRKQQQKSRNLTAATAFPNGMHATLLELDAVAEIEKKKRKGQKVNLAWEAEVPSEDEDSDEDVPLGVLFPGREGLANKNATAGHLHASDWDRPLGLIAQRELEDNEPLSKRRNRLVGADPRRRPQMQDATLSQQHLSVPTSGTPQPESEEEGEGETLAQRLRRLRDKKALDEALDKDVRKSTVSGDFAAEMMSQFGVSEKEEAKPTPPAGEEEEETLGQRRARLQAEAVARGDANPLGSRPPLRGSVSLANILSAHPIDTTNAPRKVSDEMLLNSLPQGSLLHQNALAKSRKDAAILERNNRVSSYGSLDQPLLGANVEPKAPELAVAAKIQAYKDKMAGTSLSRPNPHSAGPSLMPTPMSGPNPSMPNLPIAGQRDSYFPQPNMPMASPMRMPGMNSSFVYPGSGGMMPQHQQQQQMMAMNMGMMGMPMSGMQGAMLGNPYQQMGGGMRQSSMVNLPMNMSQMQMQQQHQMMMEQAMDPRQRDMIDRWRNGVV